MVKRKVKLKRQFFKLCLTAAIIFALYFSYLYLKTGLYPGYHSIVYTPKKYIELKENQKSDLAELKEKYLSGNKATKTKLINQERASFQENFIEEYFPFWKGTKWAFHGTTEVPGNGKVACGYFVTTVLRDMNYPIKRVSMAQATSEDMIKSFASEKHIKRFSNYKLSDFEEAILNKGDGVYVVGLDNHTGFIFCENKEAFFIHSSGRYPWRVIKERVGESIVLEKSKYRVLGDLTANDDFMKKRLLN